MPFIPQELVSLSRSKSNYLTQSNYQMLNRLRGEDLAKKTQIGNSNTYIKFPENFCTKPLVNGKCKESVTLSVIIFESNPYVRS